MVNEKVVIPQEVAEAIEYYKSSKDGSPWSSAEVLRNLALSEGACGKYDRAINSFAKENFDTLVKALYNGYTVEKKITLELTPEELGTIIANSAVAQFDMADDYVRSNGIKVVEGGHRGSESMALYLRLRSTYDEEART